MLRFGPLQTCLGMASVEVYATHLSGDVSQGMVSQAPWSSLEGGPCAPFFSIAVGRYYALVVSLN